MKRRQRRIFSNRGVKGGLEQGNVEICLVWCLLNKLTVAWQLLSLQTYVDRIVTILKLIYILNLISYDQDTFSDLERENAFAANHS